VKLDAVKCSSLSGRPAISSMGKVWPLLQSPFHEFEPSGALVRIYRKTLALWISAVQVPETSFKA
jgi:hypothetical protein